MSICIAWERSDGAITIEWPTTEDEECLRDCERKTADRLLNRYGGVAIPHRIDSSELPEPEKDQQFFNVWEWDDSISVNMPKARGLHMNRIRKSRNVELAAKDIPFMRAIEDGDTDAQATIKTEKQTLRDIPQTFDLTTDNDTPEELKARWPAELPARE